MWLVLLLGLVNALMSFIGNRIIHFSGFDIAPVGVLICVWHGENVFFSSLVLVLSYSVVSPKELRYLWITLPVTLLLGFLAPVIPNAYLLIILYHIIGVLAALLFQYFGAKYVMFILMNLSLNFIVARFYNAVFT